MLSLEAPRKTDYDPYSCSLTVTNCKILLMDSILLMLFSLNAKLDELRKARANTFLDKWDKSSSDTIKWMETCENEMQLNIEEKQSLAEIRERLDDLDVSARHPHQHCRINCGFCVITRLA